MLAVTAVGPEGAAPPQIQAMIQSSAREMLKDSKRYPMVARNLPVVGLLTALAVWVWQIVALANYKRAIVAQQRVILQQQGFTPTPPIPAPVATPGKNGADSPQAALMNYLMNEFKGI